jgi:hypothetical protein
VTDGLKVAGVIRVERRGRIARLFIDDVELPYHLAREPIEVGPVDPDDMPSVRFTLLADRVEVVDALDPEPEPEQEKHP